MVPSAATYSRSVLGQLGRTGETAGYWPHSLLTAAFRLAGGPAQTWLLSSLTRIRARALRRAAREAALTNLD